MTTALRCSKQQAGLWIAKAIICATMAIAEVAAANSDFVDDAIAELGFKPTQKQDLVAGRIISVGLPFIERHPTELTVGAAMMLVRRPLQEVTDALIDDDSFHFNTDILDFRALGDGAASHMEIDAGFRGIGYTDLESAEVSGLLGVKRGERFNFSADEIAQFRSFQGADEQVPGILAGILRQRFEAYQEGGLPAVEPYARKKGKSASPHQELKTAFASIDLIRKHFPTFYTSLSDFPARLPADTESQFYWLKRVTDKRPAFVLSHRMAERRAEYTVAMELQFYVQHTYNSMLTLVAGVPVDDGTLVLSAVRVFTDQVTGFGSSMKKEIGRKQLADAMTEYFEEMRTALESQAASSRGPIENATSCRARVKLPGHQNPLMLLFTGRDNRLI